MIKLPKEVSSIINALESKGIKAYCVGDCVRLSLAGMDPLDWDVIALAPALDTQSVLAGMGLERLELPEKEGDAFRVVFEDKALAEAKEKAAAAAEYFGDDDDYDDEEAEDDARSALLDPDRAREAMEVAADNTIIVDIMARDDVEGFLDSQKFTIMAMADSTSHGFIDPYDGRDDMAKRLIRPVGDASESFKAEPILMLKAITMVSELGYDLAKSTYEAISANAAALAKVDVTLIRDEFIEMMGADNAGKALRMLAACGLLPYILGPEVEKLGGRETKDMEELADNMDKTLNVAERRIGLFYLCLNKKKAHKAIDYLKYDKTMHQHFVDVVDHLIDLYFVARSDKLMDFLARYGLERYIYMHNVAKAQVNVYGAPDNRVQGRIYMYKEIVGTKHPVYIEDLAITGQDLVDAGIVPDDPEKIRKMLLMLTDVIHRDRKMNTKAKLMEKAKYFKKHKLGALLRNVEWQK